MAARRHQFEAKRFLRWRAKRSRPPADFKVGSTLRIAAHDEETVRCLS